MPTPISISKLANLLVKDRKIGIASITRQTTTRKYSKNVLKVSIPLNLLGLWTMKISMFVRLQKLVLKSPIMQIILWSLLLETKTIFHFSVLRKGLNRKDTNFIRMPNPPALAKRASLFLSKRANSHKRNSYQIGQYKGKSSTTTKEC